MDDTTELQMLRRMQALEDKSKGSSDSIADYVPDWLKNVGTAIYKGAAGTAAAAADAFAGSHDSADAAMALTGNGTRQVDTSMPVSRALESTGYQPKTQGEKYVNAGVRGLTAAATGPGSLASPMRAAAIGGSAGLGGEAAGQLPGIQGTSSEPWAKVTGALLGGGLAGLGSASIKNAPQLASEMFAGTDPAQVSIAKTLMDKARIAGVPINLDQALGTDTNVTNVVRALVGTKEGQAVVNQLRDQPGQVKNLAEYLTNRLPGVVREGADIANDSQGAATDALKAARQARTDATKGLFENSGSLTPQAFAGLYRQVKLAADDSPNTNKGALLSNLADSMTTPDGKMILDIQKLNGAFRTALTNAKNVNLSSSAGDREAIGTLANTIGDLRDQIGSYSPNFAKANALYSDISANTVDPLKKSVIGRVAGLAGEQTDKEAVNKLLPILAKGRDPKATSSDILRFADATSSQPDVFQDAVKTNFSNAVAKAEQQVNGQMSPNLPAAIEKNLLGTAQQRQGFKDQLEAVAVHQGLDKDALYPGFMAAMKIISAAGKRPGTLGPDSQALQDIASQSAVASGLKMIGLAPGKPAAEGVQRYLSGDAYRTLAENLTTPEGVAKLQQLAKTPLMSLKAQTLVGSLMSANAMSKPANVTNNTMGNLQGEAQ